MNLNVEKVFKKITSTYLKKRDTRKARIQLEDYRKQILSLRAHIYGKYSKNITDTT